MHGLASHRLASARISSHRLTNKQTSSHRLASARIDSHRPASAHGHQFASARIDPHRLALARIRSHQLPPSPHQLAFIIIHHHSSSFITIIMSMSIHTIIVIIIPHHHHHHSSLIIPPSSSFITITIMSMSIIRHRFIVTRRHGSIHRIYHASCISFMHHASLVDASFVIHRASCRDSTAPPTAAAKENNFLDFCLDHQPATTNKTRTRKQAEKR
jgi:hypothetical protein